MNIYKARYLNALRKAAQINRYIKKGFHVFHQGSPIENGAMFVMRDGELLFQARENMAYLFYQNDKNWDHGYWTTIKEWNKNFLESFEVYQPSAKVIL